jgi:hypothetical protein
MTKGAMTKGAMTKEAMTKEAMTKEAMTKGRLRCAPGSANRQIANDPRSAVDRRAPGLHATRS